MKKRVKRGGPRVPRARNPYALAVRRRHPGAEVSPRAYRRRPKHKRPPVVEE
jgi:hypothetical protein